MRRFTIILAAVVVLGLIACAVSLFFDRLNLVESFSVVSVADDREASPLALAISRLLFLALVVTGVGVGVWACYRMMKARHNGRG